MITSQSPQVPQVTDSEISLPKKAVKNEKTTKVVKLEDVKESVETAQTEDNTDEPTSTIDFTTIRGLATKKIQSGSQEQVKVLLDEFKVTKLSELAQEQYDGFYKQLSEV